MSIWNIVQSTLDKSTSSAVQKEASAFLYICHMSWYWMGKITNRLGFSLNKGSNPMSNFFLAGKLFFLIP